jgi:ubiquitin C-terminal hydrolase
MDGLCGLANLGSTCYVNTLVQCLYHCSKFRDYMLDQDDCSISRQSLLAETRSLFQPMKSATGRSIIIPRRFIQVLSEKITEIDIRDQNDINEFFALFLDKLNRDHSTFLTHSPVEESPASSLMEMHRRKMDISWSLIIGKEYSKIIDLFYGQTVTQIVCGNCGHICHNYEVYSNISLPLENGCKSLRDCLSHYFNGEVLNEWTCGECKKQARSDKLMCLWRIPPILTISLKRFKYVDSIISKGFQKNDLHIDVPEELNLTDFTLDEQHNTIYHLHSVAIHTGTADNGHYYAKCKRGSSWYQYDDKEVVEIKNPNFGHGYMFFYTAKTAQTVQSL